LYQADINFILANIQLSYSNYRYNIVQIIVSDAWIAVQSSLEDSVTTFSRWKKCKASSLLTVSGFAYYGACAARRCWRDAVNLYNLILLRWNIVALFCQAEARTCTTKELKMLWLTLVIYSFLDLFRVIAVGRRQVIL
jgi:hypothetical protein